MKKVYLIRNSHMKILRELKLVNDYLKNLPKMIKYLKHNYVKL